MGNQSSQPATAHDFKSSFERSPNRALEAPELSQSYKSSQGKAVVEELKKIDKAQATSNLEHALPPVKSAVTTEMGKIETKTEKRSKKRKRKDTIEEGPVQATLSNGMETMRAHLPSARSIGSSQQPSKRKRDAALDFAHIPNSTGREEDDEATDGGRGFPAKKRIKKQKTSEGRSKSSAKGIYSPIAPVATGWFFKNSAKTSEGPAAARIKSNGLLESNTTKSNIAIKARGPFLKPRSNALKKPISDGFISSDTGSEYDAPPKPTKYPREDISSEDECSTVIESVPKDTLTFKFKSEGNSNSGSGSGQAVSSSHKTTTSNINNEIDSPRDTERAQIVASDDDMTDNSSNCPILPTALPPQNQRRKSPEASVASSTKGKHKSKKMLSSEYVPTSRKTATFLLSQSSPVPPASMTQETRSGAFGEAEIEAIEEFRQSWCEDRSLPGSKFTEMVHKNARNNREVQLFWEHMKSCVPGRASAAIQKYCRRRYHDFEKTGSKWTVDEEQKVKELIARNGFSWVNISKALGRTPEDVRDRFRNLISVKDTRDVNKWTNFQVLELRRAVGSCLLRVMRDEADDEDEFLSGRYIHDNLDDFAAGAGSMLVWEAVSKEMKGKRSRLQCSYKWRRLVASGKTSPKKEIEAAWKLLVSDHIGNDNLGQSGDQRDDLGSTSRAVKILDSTLTKEMPNQKRKRSSTKEKLVKNSLRQSSKKANLGNNVDKNRTSKLNFSDTSDDINLRPTPNLTPSSTRINQAAVPNALGFGSSSSNEGSGMSEDENDTRIQIQARTRPVARGEHTSINTDRGEDQNSSSVSSESETETSRATEGPATRSKISGNNSSDPETSDANDSGSDDESFQELVKMRAALAHVMDNSDNQKVAIQARKF